MYNFMEQLSHGLVQLESDDNIHLDYKVKTIMFDNKEFVVDFDDLEMTLPFNMIKGVPKEWL